MEYLVDPPHFCQNGSESKRVSNCEQPVLHLNDVNHTDYRIVLLLDNLPHSGFLQFSHYSLVVNRRIWTHTS